MVPNQVYSLCDLPVQMQCQEPEQNARIRSLWEGLFILKNGKATSLAPIIGLRFKGNGCALEGPVLTEKVFESSSLRVSKTGDGFYLQSGASSLDLDLSTSYGIGVLAEEFWGQPLQNQREFFLLGLLMLLHRHKLYGLHSNAIAEDDVGYLIVGDSGSGKTTLTISLVREGWAYLSDDALILRQTDQGVDALAFRRGFSCTADTATHFPELQASYAQYGLLKFDKRLVDLGLIFPSRSILQCYPRVLLFPRITQEQHSQLVPLDDTTAFTLLAQQSPGIMTDRSWVGTQVETLKRLIDQTASYQLLLGNDVHRDPAAVSQLLCEARRD